MPSLPRQLAAAAVTVVPLGAGAAPALASPRTPTASAVGAKTPLTEKIASVTPYFQEKYPDGLYQNSSECQDDAYVVSRVHADSAQLPEKLEWVLGVYLQRRGDLRLLRGYGEQGRGHMTAGDRSLKEGFADFRLSNYYIAQADTRLGVRHPALSAGHYQPYRAASRPPGAPGKAPMSLVATIAMGTPVIQESLPNHLSKSYYSVRLPDGVASNDYWVRVGRMHADPSQRPAQREWVKGVRAQQLGDDLLSRGTNANGARDTETGNREINAGLKALRRANSEISHADALLGVHQSGPSAKLPTKVVYHS